jgi:hypothetical protein
VKNKAIAVVTGIGITLGLGWLLLGKNPPAEAIDEGIVLREGDSGTVTVLNVGAIFKVKLYDNFFDGYYWARSFDPSQLTLINETSTESADGSREWVYTFSADAAGDNIVTFEHMLPPSGVFDKVLTFNLHITAPAVGRKVG